VVGRPDLPSDPRFVTTLDRAKNQATLKDILEALFAHKPVAHWVAAFRAEGVPCEPIMTYGDVLASDQVKAMNWVRDITLPSGAVTRTVGPVVALSAVSSGIYRNPPGLNADRDDILGELDTLGV
jgi:crotonobetainyl-CoA:carnitine CoA-transferase CaiB-like acyl-CoA transferase